MKRIGRLDNCRICSRCMSVPVSVEHHLAGTLHASAGMDDCFAVVARCAGSRRVAATLARSEDRPAGIEATHILRTMLKDDEVGPMIYRDFLPQALAAGTFVPARPAKVVGHGLETLQTASEAVKGGVCAARASLPS
jgi:hypothetical protein